MFDMLFGLRLWRGHKLQGLLLVAGFAVFACLIHVALTLAQPLFSTTPAWVQANDRFVTIGLRGHDGKLQKTSIQNLEAWGKSEGIDALGYIGSYSASFRLDEREFAGQALMFSDALSELLEVPDISRDAEAFRGLAYVSQRFWQEHFANATAQSLAEKTLLLGVDEYPLRIAGVLPAELDQVGEWRPDILVSDRHLMELKPISFGEDGPPPEFRQMVLEQLRQMDPLWYGIARLAPGFQTDDLTLTVEPEAGPDNIRVFTHSENMEPYLFAGIEFQPDVRRALVRQWWLVLGLALAFGLVNALNLLTLSFNRLLQRSAEFGVRIAVGANGGLLLRQVLLEQVPLLLTSLVLGLILSALTLPQWLAQHEVSVTATAGMFVTATLVTVLVLVLLVALCACLPLLQLWRRDHFSRDRSGQSSPWQQRLGLGNIVVQLCLAGLALTMALALAVEQWQQFRDPGLAGDVQEWQIEITERSGSQGLGDIRQWQAALEASEVPVALAAQSLVQPRSVPGETRLGTPDNPVTANINHLGVSENYFAVVQAPLLAGEGVSERGVVLNQAAAQALGYDQPQDAVGKPLFTEGASFLLGFEEDEPIQVLGVVANLPHFGLVNRDVPMLYGDLRRVRLEMQLVLLTDASSGHAVERWLEQRREQEGKLWDFESTGTLIEQLRDENHIMLRMTQLALVLGTLICVLGAASLYYQLVSHLQVRQRRYGVQLAVGARTHHVLTSVWGMLGALLLLALLPLAVVLVFAHPRFVSEFHAPLLDPLVLALTLLLLVTISFCSSFVPGYRLATRPVAALLRHTD